MAVKADLVDWVDQALRSLGGEGHVVAVAKRIWDQHEDELRSSGDLFYTWQYDMRWAATQLRKMGKVSPSTRGDRQPWRLV